MLPALILIFVVAPLVELFVIIQVAHVIGAWPTIAFLVAESIFGAWLIKRQGRIVLHRIQAQLENNRLPTKEVVDGGLILLAGVLMAAPGFITDIIGFLLLIPPTRAIARTLVMRHFKDRLGTGYSFLSGAGTGGFGGFVFGGPADVFDTTGHEQERYPELPAPATPVSEVELRDAATVLILRDGEPDADGNALEVFMLRRNLNSDFVGGAYVFPGGAVDPEDRFDDLEPLCEGRTDVDASTRLGVDSGGLAFWVAAIRESFEEAGVLLAYHEDGEVIRLDDPATAERFVAHRTAVDTKARRLVEICDEEHLRLAVDSIWYFGHWITPVGAPRRYDTRFFVTAAPPAQTPLHDDHEVIANLWVRPGEALARHGRGDYEMLPPTIASLRAVARFATAAEALAAATEITDVPTILPRVIVDDGGVRIVLPGDPEYGDGYTGTDPLGHWPTVAERNRNAIRVQDGAGLTESPMGGVEPDAVAVGRRRSRGHAVSHPSSSDLAEPVVAAPKPIVAEVASALSPMVRRITAANPGKMTGPGTNTYLVGIDEIAVIDPGPADDDHLDAVAGCGGDRIRWILCTHTHPDHSPGAAGLKARTGAEVLAFDSRDGLVVDRAMADGDTVDGTEFTLRAIHTPGHASNHLCYLLEGERLLFTGDHVMQGSTVVIAPPDGDMAVYLDSLRRVAALRPRLKAIAPGHGLLITDPADAVADYLAHRLDRERQVLGALKAGPRTPAEIVEVLYADVADELHEVAAKSVWAHLRKLQAEGKATVDDPDHVESPWTTA